jgi:hypothetical protein
VIDRVATLAQALDQEACGFQVVFDEEYVHGREE